MTCGKCASDFINRRLQEISDFIRVPMKDIHFMVTSAHREEKMGAFEYGHASEIRSGFRMGDLLQEEHTCSKAKAS